MIDLRALIANTQNLVPLAPTVARLAVRLGREDCELSEITEIIAYDQILTLQLLRAANSAASASALPVTTVQEAVLRLGAAKVLSLIVAANIKGLVAPSLPQFGLTEGGLWRHSVAAAASAELFTELCPIPVPAEAFTTALLHDVGKLILARFLTPEVLAFLHRARAEGGLNPFEAEAELLQVHHGEVGGLVAQHWQLPDSIVQAIIHHHTPEKLMQVTCDVTYLANLAAHRIEAHTAGQPFTHTPDPRVLERLELKPARWDAAMAAVPRFHEILARYEAL